MGSKAREGEISASRPGCRGSRETLFTRQELSRRLSSPDPKLIMEGGEYENIHPR